MDTFGKRLKVLRKNKNMTQEELANALNISFQAISKWENEISNPDLSLIVPLAAVLGVSTDTLLGAFEQQDISRQEGAKKITNWTKDGRAQKLEIALTLIEEMPNTPDATYWYACCVYDCLEYDVPEEEKSTTFFLPKNIFKPRRKAQNIKTHLPYPLLLFSRVLEKLLYPLSDDAYYQELCVCYNFRARSAIEKG